VNSGCFVPLQSDGRQVVNCASFECFNRVVTGNHQFLDGFSPDPFGFEQRPQCCSQAQVLKQLKASHHKEIELVALPGVANLTEATQQPCGRELETALDIARVYVVFAAQGVESCTVCVPMQEHRSAHQLAPILRSHGWAYLAPLEITDGGFQ
jgi:hypothetical protein